MLASGTIITCDVFQCDDDDDEMENRLMKATSQKHINQMNYHAGTSCFSHKSHKRTLPQLCEYKQQNATDISTVENVDVS